MHGSIYAGPRSAYKRSAPHLRKYLAEWRGGVQTSVEWRSTAACAGEGTTRAGKPYVGSSIPWPLERLLWLACAGPWLWCWGAPASWRSARQGGGGLLPVQQRCALTAPLRRSYFHANLEVFIRAHYGDEIWRQSMERAGLQDLTGSCSMDWERGKMYADGLFKVVWGGGEPCAPAAALAAQSWEQGLRGCSLSRRRAPIETRRRRRQPQQVQARLSPPLTLLASMKLRALAPPPSAPTTNTRAGPPAVQRGGRGLHYKEKPFICPVVGPFCVQH